MYKDTWYSLVRFGVNSLRLAYFINSRFRGSVTIDTWQYNVTEIIFSLFECDTVVMDPFVSSIIYKIIFPFVLVMILILVVLKYALLYLRPFEKYDPLLRPF